jgi:hypothetical protein
MKLREIEINKNGTAKRGKIVDETNRKSEAVRLQRWYFEKYKISTIIEK